VHRSWGIEPTYEDVAQETHEVPEATLAALLEEMGASSDGPPDAPVRTCRPGEVVDLRGELLLEDGGSTLVDGRVGDDVDHGYHDLVTDDGDTVRLIVSPGRCHLADDLRIWGWSAQLYAARSARSWGIGDLADLAVIARRTGEVGGGVVLVNPLHASLPGADVQQPSPYFPSSRCARNPLYLRIEDVPGASSLGDDLEKLAAEARALDDDGRIDRPGVYLRKLAALEQIWDAGAGDDPQLDRYIDEGGATLAGYGVFCAVHEQHGPDWRTWPEGLRHPQGAAITRFSSEHTRRIRFHQWVQWLLDRQLAAASSDVAVVQDLAVGVDPAGADAWLWQDAFASGVSVGAPPDEFNRAGQDWGFSPFDPWKLRSAAYEPFVQTVRAALAHAGGLRIDHVMGLARLWWIPRGSGPADGAYVRYPAGDLLDIVALESQRAGAWIVGEDLGTVEESLRDELHARGVLSYRLVYFEQEPPEQFPRQALAAVTTHDLPTVAGLWSGADLDRQRELGLEPNVESTMEIRDRLGQWTGLDGDVPVEEAVVAVHELLATAPSMVVTVTLEDVAGVEERPNHPGTDDPANWSTPLPVEVEELLESPAATRITQLLQEGRP
jgi:4-alpha-glucanotransferase